MDTLLELNTGAPVDLAVAGSYTNPLYLLLILERGTEQGLLAQLRRDHVLQLRDTLTRWLDGTRA